MKLDNFFDEFISIDINSKANEWATSVAYFFLEKGVSYNEFKELPVPYILKMLEHHNKVIEKQKRKK